MSDTIAWAIGCSALKNRLAVNRRAAINHTFGCPPAITKPNPTVRAHWMAVKLSSMPLRPQPRCTAQSDSQPPAGKPRRPAPALNAAIRADLPNDECAASATIATDQNEKNHRFHRTANIEP